MGSPNEDAASSNETPCLLRWPDIWPPGDVALLTSLRKVKRRRAVPTNDQAATVAESWRPWRAVAARLLWHDYLRARGR